MVIIQSNDELINYALVHNNMMYIYISTVVL